MNETTKTVIDAVVIFLSSSVGATILGIIGKTVVNAIASVKTKKYSKLTDSDRTLIVAEVKEGVIAAIRGGVSVDMDAQIDKATARRITAVEKSQNEIIAQVSQLMNWMRVVLLAIGDFKTISQPSKEQIQGILGVPAGNIPALTVVEQPMLQVAQVEQESVDEKPKKHKVAY